MENQRRRRLWMLDVDGTILKHQGNATGACTSNTILDGVVDFFNLIHSKGDQIIITTGRTESMREVTEKQLREHGLFWDILLMGIATGERMVVNDYTNTNEPKAIAINIERNSGLMNVNELYSEAKIAAGAPKLKYTI